MPVRIKASERDLLKKGGKGPGIASEFVTCSVFFLKKMVGNSQSISDALTRDKTG